MTATQRRRADIRTSRKLSRAADRKAVMTPWLAKGVGPQQKVREILLRLSNTEAAWRKILAITRAAPVVPDQMDDRRGITSQAELPGWLLLLEHRIDEAHRPGGQSPPVRHRSEEGARYCRAPREERPEIQLRARPNEAALQGLPARGPLLTEASAVPPATPRP